LTGTQTYPYHRSRLTNYVGCVSIPQQYIDPLFLQAETRIHTRQLVKVICRS